MVDDVLLRDIFGGSGVCAGFGIDRIKESAHTREAGGDRREKILLEQIRNGDEDSFEELVRVHTARTIRLAYRLVADREDAEEIAQTAFLRLYKALPAFRGESSIATWLYTTVTRLATDHLKRENRRKKIFFFTRKADEKMDLLAKVPDSAPSPRDQLLAGEAEKQLAKILKTLSPQQRAVFVLRHQEELSLREIAEMLHLELGTVKTHLHRAVSVLRKKLNHLQEGLP